MALKPGEIVLLDTNVIIEIHRVGCLNSLASYFRLHTVEKVVEETQTGFQNRRPEQTIDLASLLSSLANVGSVTDEQRAEFNLTYGHPPLDAGERDLLVYADSIGGGLWLLNSPDMAAIRFAHGRGWIDRLVSLEAMTSHLRVRLKESLKENYTESWLSTRRTMLLLS